MYRAAVRVNVDTVYNICDVKWEKNKMMPLVIRYFFDLELLNIKSNSDIYLHCMTPNFLYDFNSL